MTRQSPGKAGAKRVGWTIADQAVSSLTNFGLSFWVARSVTSNDFGAFAIIFSVFVLLTGMARSLGSDVLGVRFSTVSLEKWQASVGHVAGLVLIIGLGSGAVVMLIGVAVGGSFGHGLIALGVATPALLLQDMWRFAFFSRGTPLSAVVNDGIWAVFLFGGLLWMTAASIATMPAFVLTWGAASGVAALVGFKQARVWPKFDGLRDWLRQHSDLTPAFAGEFLIRGGASQLVLFALGFVASLDTVASFRGAQLLLGPATVLLRAIVPIAVPEGARLLVRSPQLLRRGMAAASLSVAGVVVAWSAVALALPDRAGEALLGETWPGASAALPALSAYLVLVGLSVGPTIGLRVLELPMKSLKIRAYVAPILLGGGILGGSLAGASGAAIGMAIPLSVGNLAWWLAFWREVRGARR